MTRGLTNTSGLWDVLPLGRVRVVPLLKTGRTNLTETNRSYVVSDLSYIVLWGMLQADPNNTGNIQLMSSEVETPLSSGFEQGTLLEPGDWWDLPPGSDLCNHWIAGTAGDFLRWSIYINGWTDQT